MSYTENYIDYPNGVKIRCRVNDHNAKRPVVVFIHGTGECLELYDYMYPYFETVNLSLNALELRGSGKSTGHEGHIENFGEYTKDLRRFILGNLQNKSVYLAAVSSSCLTVLRLAQDLRFSVKGLVLISPLTEIRLPFPKSLAVSLLSRISPGHYMNSSLKPASAAEKRNPSNTGVTAAFIRAFADEGKKMLSDGHLLSKVPMLVMTADENDDLDVSRSIETLSGLYSQSGLMERETVRDRSGNVLLGRHKVDALMKITSWIGTRELPE